MNPEEFFALHKIEKEHWFYRGKREIILGWLNKLNLLIEDPLYLDIGAGTGLLSEELQKMVNIIAIDPDPNALNLIKSRKGVIGLSAYANKIPLDENQVDVLICLDVIEHIDDDQSVINEFIRVVKPGGHIFITVPAFQFVWSEWDDALGHKRRYTVKSLTELISSKELNTIQLSYINVFAFFPILVYRLLRNLANQSNNKRMEDWIPPKFYNDILRESFVVPALSNIRFPLGLSLFCILQVT